MDRRITFDVKTHAGFAAGDQHGFAADEARQLGGSHRDLRLGGHRPMHRGGQLLGIRRDQRRAAIDAVIVAFGIDHDRFAEAPRRFDDGANDARGERAFGIVGQHHRAGFGQRRFGKADDRGFAFPAGRVRGLPIGAQQVGGVMLRDEAHLARGWPRVVDHQLGCDRLKLAELIGQYATGLVVADQTDEDAVRPERGDVARDVAGAADLHLAPAHGEHRRRRLRRNARHVAIDEIVEHDVADAEHGLLGNTPEGFFKIEHALPRPAPRSPLTDGDRRGQDNRSRSA